MTIRKIGFPTSKGVDAAMAEALQIVASETGLSEDKFEADDVTTPDHEANNEILIRVSPKE
jgi:hypothetical protein